jgi:predicted amidohydrolase
MIIIAGAPVWLGGALHIGAFIIFPSGTEALYTKHYLFSEEIDYFTPNQDYTPVILYGGENISLAICFDIENRQHIAQAKNIGSTLLIPSIFYSEAGIEDAHRLLAYDAGDSITHPDVQLRRYTAAKAAGVRAPSGPPSATCSPVSKRMFPAL